MKLNQAIADRIVKRTMQIIPNSVNVMDSEGVIIASGDVGRIGQRHTGAVIALRNDQAVEIDENLAKQWCDEVKAGINLPLHYLGSTIGVVGISGQPQQVRQYAQLVKMAAELIMQQAFELEQERWQRRYREEFVRALLKGSLSTAEIQQQAVFFGQDFAKPLSVMVIKIHGSTAEKLQRLIDFFEHYFPSLLTAVIGLDKIALLNHLSNEKSLIRNALNKLNDPDISFKTWLGWRSKIYRKPIFPTKPPAIPSIMPSRSKAVSRLFILKILNCRPSCTVSATLGSENLALAVPSFTGFR